MRLGRTSGRLSELGELRLSRLGGRHFAPISICRSTAAISVFFRCTILRATLSTAGCSENWRRAQQLSADELGFSGKCGDCPIGAVHANGRHAHRSKWFGAQICPRTRRWASRLIGGRLGISAWNRQREWALGKNAKGTAPQLVLAPRRLGVILGYGEENQRHLEIRDDITLDTIEIAVQTLHVATGRIAFCRPRGGPSISTADLARQFAPAPSMARGLISHAAKPRPRHRLAAIDRLPNEDRGEPRSNVSDGEGALARNLAAGAMHERESLGPRKVCARRFAVVTWPRLRRASRIAASARRP
jgi:hypothetical protein